MIDGVVAAVEAVTSRRVVARHEPPGNGYTPAIRFVAELDSGDRVFVKAAPDRHIGGWIQQEIAFYRSVDGPFLPSFVGARDATATELPVLVIEDLSAALWPPPWDDGSIEAVLAALDRGRRSRRPHRYRLVDWNQACRANAELDLACWAPSLAYERGMDPEELGFEIDPGLAAVVAGFFAARAGLPAIPKAPGVREVQLAQLAVALPWAARQCGFATP